MYICSIIKEKGEENGGYSVRSGEVRHENGEGWRSALCVASITMKGGE